MAEVIAKLMARLGYSRYGAQGGDWGSGVHPLAGHRTTAPTAWAATATFLRAGQPPRNPCGRDAGRAERMAQRRKELADQ